MGVVMRAVLVLLCAGAQGCYQADFSADGGAVVCSNDEGCAEGRRCLRGVCLKSSTGADVGAVEDVGVSPPIEEAGPTVNDAGSITNDLGAASDVSLPHDANSPVVNDAGPIDSSCFYAIDFVGDGETVEIPDHDDLKFASPWTVAAWLKPQLGGHFISKPRGDGMSGLWFEARSDQSHISWCATVGRGGCESRCRTNGNGLAQNRWNHIAATWDGVTLKIYNDGEETASSSCSIEPGSVAVTPLSIGAAWRGGQEGNSFDGLIGPLTIWGDVRSAEELRDHAQAPQAEVAGSSVHYPMLTASRTITNSSNEAEHNGVLTANLSRPRVCHAEWAAACGNGRVEVGELCDDGNTDNGDGCTSTCAIEVKGRYLWPEPNGESAEQAATSCHAIANTHPRAPSGVYYIDPDGGGETAAHQVYCDMETAGGGWSLIAVEGNRVVDRSIFADGYCTVLDTTCAGRAPDWADSAEFLMRTDRGWIHVGETNERILSGYARLVNQLAAGGPFDNQLLVHNASVELIGGTRESRLYIWNDRGLAFNPITNGDTPWWTLNYAESPAHFQAQPVTYSALLYRHVEPDWQAVERFSQGERDFVLGYVESGIYARDVQPLCALAGGFAAALDSNVIHERASSVQRSRTDEGAWFGARKGGGQCNRAYCWYPWDNSARLLSGGFDNWAANQSLQDHDFAWQDQQGFWRSDSGNEQLSYFWCEGAAP